MNRNELKICNKQIHSTAMYIISHGYSHISPHICPAEIHILPELPISARARKNITHVIFYISHVWPLNKTCWEGLASLFVCGPLVLVRTDMGFRRADMDFRRANMDSCISAWLTSYLIGWDLYHTTHFLHIRVQYRPNMWCRLLFRCSLKLEKMTPKNTPQKVWRCKNHKSCSF